MNRNKNIREKYKAIDPYFKQNYIKDLSTESALYELYDEPQYDLDRLRDRRQIDITPLQEGQRTYEKYLTPLYAITAFFGAMMIIGPFLVKQGPNRGIVQASIMLSAFCMWIFWFTIYFGQMNPLMGPRLENTTVAWIAYKIGNPFKGSNNTTDGTI